MNINRQNALSIFNKYIDKIGGLTNLKKIKSKYVEAACTINDFLTHSKYWYQFPILYRHEILIGKDKEVYGDDGLQRWFLDKNGMLQIFDDDKTKSERIIEQNVNLYRHLNPESKIFSWNFIPDNVSKYPNLIAISLKNNLNNNKIEYYFDPKTILLIYQIDYIDDLVFEINYLDYRRNNDLLFSYYQKVEVAKLKQFHIIKIIKIEINKIYSGKLFSSQGL